MFEHNEFQKYQYSDFKLISLSQDHLANWEVEFHFHLDNKSYIILFYIDLFQNKFISIQAQIPVEEKRIVHQCQKILNHIEQKIRDNSQYKLEIEKGEIQIQRKMSMVDFEKKRKETDFEFITYVAVFPFICALLPLSLLVFPIWSVVKCYFVIFAVSLFLGVFSYSQYTKDVYRFYKMRKSSLYFYSLSTYSFIFWLLFLLF